MSINAPRLLSRLTVRDIFAKLINILNWKMNFQFDGAVHSSTISQLTPDHQYTKKKSQFLPFAASEMKKYHISNIVMV